MIIQDVAVFPVRIFRKMFFLRKGSMRMFFCCFGFRYGSLFFRNKFFKYFRGHRLGKIISLDDLASQFFQGFHLLFRFYAFGDDGNGKIIRDVDDQFDHAGIFASAESRADKFHIQFQRVDGQRGKHVQGGITAAEVVHLDAEAKLAQPADFFDDLRGIGGVGGLRNFQQVFRGGNIIFVYQALEIVHKVRVKHIDPGYVDRNRDSVTEPVFPPADLGGHFPPDKLVQLPDQAVFFKQRDKSSRTDHTQFRMLPPNQGFRAGKRGNRFLYIKLRLVIHLELTLRQRVLKILQQPVGQYFALVQFGIIKRNCLFVCVAAQVGSHFGPVKAALYINCLIDVLIHADAQPDVVAGVVFIQIDGSIFQQFVIVQPLAAIYKESIGFQTAGEPPCLFYHRANLFRRAPEDQISVFFSVPFIDDMEMVDIDEERVHGEILIAFCKLSRIAEKIFAGVQFCYRISFGRLDQFAVFGQFNGTLDTRQDNGGRRIGFGNEITGAQLQAFDFRTLIGSHDDDRDLPHLFVSFDHL